MADQIKKYWTVEEYLAFERESDVKYEYIDGEIYAMSGGTDKHSSIAVNCTIEIGLQLRGKSCRVFNSDMKVKISDIKYVYPDFSVVCGQAEFSDGKHMMLTNPTLVAEVMSESSIDYDKGSKADYYRGLPSVQTYLVIDQEKVLAQLYTRQESGWHLSEYSTLEDIVPLDSIGCSLKMSEIYRDIDSD
ncbi:MAG: Uma2 family endonuclease [Phototrophicaceae bacterium]